MKKSETKTDVTKNVKKVILALIYFCFPVKLSQLVITWKCSRIARTFYIQSLMIH